MLKIGDKAPDFIGDSALGGRIASSAHRGKKLVVYFFWSTHPLSLGCRDEARRFRDNYPELRALGADVIGISTNKLDTSCRFSERNRISFPIIADADHSIASSWGVFRKLPPIDMRVTFVLDESGVVSAVFHHEWQMSVHLDEVLKFIKSFPPPAAYARALGANGSAHRL